MHSQGFLYNGLQIRHLLSFGELGRVRNRTPFLEIFDLIAQPRKCPWIFEQIENHGREANGSRIRASSHIHHTGTGYVVLADLFWTLVLDAQELRYEVHWYCCIFRRASVGPGDFLILCLKSISGKLADMHKARELLGPHLATKQRLAPFREYASSSTVD